EGRVDSVAQHLFPIMSRAHCRSLMFGIESGSQRVLDRLNKRQTLEQIRRAVNDAKGAGIALVHGFFVVGTPDERIEDIRATFDFAAKIRLDTYAFNRLCVYRTTPLWDEYVKRGLIDDAADWDKYFKCSDIDPTCLPGPVINRERKNGFSRIFAYKLTHYPIQTLRLVVRLTRYMAFGDIVYLIFKPFMKGNRRVPAKEGAGPVTAST
ncbi:MAG TPA: radical SAM protein, partial [bacterium]|nr:radical SAM protein [bacterium]